MIHSSNILVDGVHFVDWFNGEFRGKYGKTIHPTLKVFNQPAHLAPSNINKAKFNEVFDQCAEFWAPELSFAKFLGFLLIFYNETGGTLTPRAEAYWITPLSERMKYLFESGSGKASYNHQEQGNRGAGDQLASVLQDDDAVTAWNSTTQFPDDATAAILQAAQECDFYKYRGHGLFQLTWRNSYLKAVDPLLAQCGYAKCDDLAEAELTRIIRDDVRINLPMVKNYVSDASVRAHLDKLTESASSYVAWGTRISGNKNYGRLVEWRADTIFKELKGGTSRISSYDEPLAKYAFQWRLRRKRRC